MLDQLDAGHATYFSPSRQATMQLPVKAPDTRVDSFLFFYVSQNTKMYKTGNFFAEFRLFHKAEKNTKIQKRVLSCFVKKQNNVSFFSPFFLNFVPYLQNL